jgi:Cu(I)/Ag(I) efflux system membrane fusion protein
MNRNIQIITLLLVLVISGYGAYTLGLRRGLNTSIVDDEVDTPSMPASSMEDPSGWTTAQLEDATRRHVDEGIAAGDVDPVTGRAVLHYYDPMRPASRFDAPGKSPFMDMMLVPAYEGMQVADAGTVTVDSRLQQNSGVRIAEVRSGSVAQEVDAIGTVAWNEREEVVLQARNGGFVEKLHVRASLDRVEAGQPLVDLYVPEWLAAQEEYLALNRIESDRLDSLRDAARLRMRQVGMNEQQIEAVTSSSEVQAVITFNSPVTGIVSELGIREGTAVMPGDLLFRLNGTGTVWAYADVPESQASLLVEGGSVTAISPSLPGMSFIGTIQSMLAQVDPGLRTRRARIELPNPEGRLATGMLMQMRFQTQPQENVLMVPTEALIRTGSRTLVMLAEDGGRFRPQQVTTGVESGGQTVIIEGVQAGQRVVLSGQFLLDSEASLAGLEARLSEVAAEDNGMAVHRTSARIDAVTADTVTLSHPPIPSIEWPSMTMGFALPADRSMVSGLAVGADVEVEFYLRDDGRPEIVMMQPGPAPAATGDAQ